MGFLSAPIDRFLALSLPQFGKITAPTDVPTGGLSSTGQDVIRTGLSFFLIIVILLAIFYLLIGALRYIYSRGDKQRIQGAREKITYSIVGLIIAFLAFPLMTIIGKFFNLPLLSPFTVSVSDSCRACPNIDPITVTARATDIEFGILEVTALVDTNGDGTWDLVKTCNSSPCMLNVGTLPPGTYKYYGTARNNAPVRQDKSTQPQSFEIKAATCNLLNSCDKCLTKIGCVWAGGLGIPLRCYDDTHDPDACLNTYTELHRASCVTDECSSIPTNTPVPTTTGAPTPTRTPTPTGAPGATPTPSVCQNVCTTIACTRSGNLPGVILNVFVISGSTCLLSGTPCVDSTVCPFPTSTPPLSTPTPVPTATPLPTSTPAPTFTPAPTPTSVPVSSPDLQIWAFGNTPIVPAAGENIIFEVSVANFGGSISPDTKVRLYEDTAKPKCGDPGWFGEAPISPLVPYFQDTKIVAKPGGFSDRGAHIVWALADAACDTNESNETNNAASIFVTVF